ncbi:hypothetical protein, partial [Aestuariivivens sediminis]|uniref:hypothetical protein n=1 Tax=Aestuariivivens sediminis TaxID=2913557 RepID=UPI001F5733BB
MYNFTQFYSRMIRCCFKLGGIFSKSIMGFGLVMLFLFGAVGSFNAQTVPLETNVVAGFGVDADVEADVLEFNTNALTAFGTDDWFDYDNGHTGQGVIDVSSIPASLMNGDNVSVRLGMSQDAFYVDFEPGSANLGTTWIDALYARDQRTNGNFKDGTVFGATSDKNTQNPTTWTIKNGDVPQKNDIIDVYAHLRRAAPFGGEFAGQEIAIVGASTRSQDGTSYLDFEYFREKIIQAEDKTITYSGDDGGHTAFEFAADGLPTQLGDIIMSVNYTNGGNVADIRIFVWMDLAGIGDAELAALNALPNIPFQFGDNNGGFDYYDGGLDAGTFGYVQIQPLDGETAVWAQVNEASAVKGTPWPTIERGGDVSVLDEYPPFALAEIAINATAFGFDTNASGGVQCESPFGSFLVKTRSSDSFVAELKDLVGPYDFGDVIEVDVQVEDSCAQGERILTASLVNPGNLDITYSWFIDGVHQSQFNGMNQITVSEAGTYLVYATAGTLGANGIPDTSCYDTAEITAEPGSDLSITCPSDPNVACTDQAGLSSAFDSFISNLSISGGVGTKNIEVYIGGSIDADCVATGTLYDSNYTFPDFLCGGSLDVYFVVSDECGQVECCATTFSVQAAPEAVFDGVQADEISCDAATTFTASSLGYTNNGLGGCLIEGSVMGQLTPDYDECGGTITQDWSYTDDCGRTITQQQIITVLPAPEAVFDGVQADEISCDAATTFTASSLGYTNNGLGGCLIEGSVMGQLTPD